jgi:hypothetical protein
LSQPTSTRGATDHGFGEGVVVGVADEPTEGSTPASTSGSVNAIEV